MYEDCSKHLKNAKIGGVLLLSIPFLGVLVKLFSINNFMALEIIYVISIGIYAYIKMEPYITCLSKYNEKKF